MKTDIARIDNVMSAETEMYLSQPLRLLVCTVANKTITLVLRASNSIRASPARKFLQERAISPIAITQD
ncbi:MAG: hypothetical protein CL398_08520 [Acidiferrobacteraceae bacterium]|nr:hypothetical protein [Acidiferrobacteraceae bacterium]